MVLPLLSHASGTSIEKLYHELGLESIQQRKSYRTLCCYFKIHNSKFPDYLFKSIPSLSNRKEMLIIFVN